MKTSQLTSERLRELLDYDPTTGIFTWQNCASRKRRCGDVAGSFDARRYVQIRIDGKMYKAHRLAWLFVYGRWPAEQVDHINRVKSDNRIGNLRECSNKQNHMNQGKRKNARSDCPNVYPRGDGRWRVFLRVMGIRRHIGSFGSYEEAVTARNQAIVALRGEFASGLAT